MKTKGQHNEKLNPMKLKCSQICYRQQRIVYQIKSTNTNEDVEWLVSGQSEFV